MIFISHNNKDKDKVEPIALALRQKYGKENVFYDSWSIQPSQGIIGRMSQGLDNVKFFFLFLSENSLNSSGVGLEWESALFKKLTQHITFTIVLLEKCDVPTILAHLKNIDYYHEGQDMTLKRIIDVIEGQDTFVPKKRFNNTIAIFNAFSYPIKGRIEAIHHMEPYGAILLEVGNSVHDVEVKVMGLSLPEDKRDNFEVMPNYRANIIKISRLEPITPEFPLRFEIKSTGGELIYIKGVYIRKGEDKYKQIPMKYDE